MKKIFTLALVVIAAMSMNAQTTTVVRVLKDGQVVSQEPVGDNLQITFAEVDDNCVPGDFSVSSTKKVRFSKGNLQYQASTQTWRFAENQWDQVGNATQGTVYVGEEKCDNGLISDTYTGWIDLFGWGTGNNPTQTSSNNADYATFTDWGVNPISNGGNEPNQWRTLTEEEWNYLLTRRPGANVRRGLATVNGVEGVILLPDEWGVPNGFDFNYSISTFAENKLTKKQWAAFEKLGAVFIPCGYRYGTTTLIMSTGVNVWTSTPDDRYSDDSYDAGISKNFARTTQNERHYGCSVRLVKDL